jgi:hypothetical protein
VSATTQGGGGDTEPPSIPQNLTASAVSSSRINLSWSASSDNVGVSGYRIYREGVNIATTTGLNYSDIGLSASTTYNYTVSAYDAAGNESGRSNQVSATTFSGGGGGNNPPILNHIGDKYINVGDLLVFTITGSDPDNDPLTFSALNLPYGASLNSSTGKFEWVPRRTGNYSVTFRVSDGRLIDSESIIIHVINGDDKSVRVNITGEKRTDEFWTGEQKYIAIRGYIKGEDREVKKVILEKKEQGKLYEKAEEMDYDGKRELKINYIIKEDKKTVYRIILKDRYHNIIVVSNEVCL